MSVEIELLETWAGVPIVEVRFTGPAVFDAETHRAQMAALLSYPAPRLAVIVNENLVSSSPLYGPEAQAATIGSVDGAALRSKLVCLFRYQATSFTSLVSTLQAHRLQEAGAIYAPDQYSAIRAARKTIDRANTAGLRAETRKHDENELVEAAT
jgi:hypothetical protein